MKDNSLEDLSLIQLYREHDVLKTITSKLSYSTSPTISFYADEFYSHSDFSKNFEPFANDLSWVNVPEIIDRLARLYLVKPKDMKFLEGGGLIYEILVEDPIKIKDYAILVEKEIAKRKGQGKKFCRFENGTFFVTLSDGSEQSINFNAKSGSNAMTAVFETLFDYWKTAGQDTVNGITATVPVELILIQTKKLTGKDVIQEWIKNTIGNIRRTKLKPSNLSERISITYDKKSNGYIFLIVTS